jgi:hypothetical protein
VAYKELVNEDWNTPNEAEHGHKRVLVQPVPVKRAIAAAQIDGCLSGDELVQALTSAQLPCIQWMRTILLTSIIEETD